MLHIDGV